MISFLLKIQQGSAYEIREIQLIHIDITSSLITNSK